MGKITEIKAYQCQWHATYPSQCWHSNTLENTYITIFVNNLSLLNLQTQEGSFNPSHYKRTFLLPQTNTYIESQKTPMCFPDRETAFVLASFSFLPVAYSSPSLLQFFPLSTIVYSFNLFFFFPMIAFNIQKQKVWILRASFLLNLNLGISQGFIYQGNNRFYYFGQIEPPSCFVKPPTIHATLFTSLIITLITTVKPDDQSIIAFLKDNASLNKNPS